MAVLQVLILVLPLVLAMRVVSVLSLMLLLVVLVQPVLMLLTVVNCIKLLHVRKVTLLQSPIYKIKLMVLVTA